MAVSTATIATKYSFFQDFRDLQDFHTFAPLRSQNFSKKSRHNFVIFEYLNNLFNSNFHEKRIKIDFLRNLDEILSEFHEHLQKMSKFAENCRKFCKNCEILAKIPKLMRLFIRSNELFSRVP